VETKTTEAVDIKKIYADYAAKGIDSAQQLGWNDLATQDRYMQLMLTLVQKHVPLKGKTVHDAGCGYGDLLTYLKKADIGPYVGTDLMEPSIEEAKKRHPGHEFLCVDLLAGAVPEADVTFCMGALAFHRSQESMLLLERLWAASKAALAFNCWWDLHSGYVNHWEAQKFQKRVQSWLKGKQAVMLHGYENTERMFLVLK
jgi:SAM-dependent methyltransferase